MRPKFDILVWKNGKAKINGSLLYYVWETFGIPKETAAAYINDKLDSDLLLRKRLIVSAYAKAKKIKLAS